MQSSLKNHSQIGFTLIETLVALAIYTVLIATLVVVNRGGLDSLGELESRALARRALANVVTNFRQQARLGRQSTRLGRYNGEYGMSHFSYQWEIQLLRSQNQQILILDAHIRRKNDQDELASIREIWR